MTWVVAALTVVVALVVLFVLGLLRSHAELLRRTSELAAELESPAGAGPAAPVSFPDGVVPAQAGVAVSEIDAIEGIDCELEPYRLAVGELSTEYLLIAFLSTSCLSCLDIWRDIIEEGAEAGILSSGDSAATTIIALKGREEENLGKARALAAETAIPVTLSAEAWTTLEVPGSPYFALVSTRERRVVGTGSAQGWDQLKSLASDGMLELSIVAGKTNRGRGRRYRNIIEREDEELRQAGIYPGHPSLSAPIMAPTAENGDEQ